MEINKETDFPDYLSHEDIFILSGNGTVEYKVESMEYGRQIAITT